MKPLDPADVNVWSFDEGCVYQDIDMPFGFDRVFGPDSSNKCIYREVKPIIDSAVDGINGTLFMYGQTGSGKTYSMIGTSLKLQTDRKSARKTQPSPMNKSARSSSQLSKREVTQSVTHQRKKTPILPLPPSRKQSIQKVEELEFPVESPKEETGVLLISLKDLFSKIQTQTPEDFTLTCSYFEIYNELIFDLLSEEAVDPLTLFED